MYGHPDAVRQSVRMAIHFFVNFEVFKSLYLSKYLPDKHQTWGFCVLGVLFYACPYIVAIFNPCLFTFDLNFFTFKFKLHV